MVNLGRKLKSFSRNLTLDGASKYLLGIRSTWATGGIVVIALFCGLLFNAVQPSLLLDYSHTEDSDSGSNQVSPESLPNSEIKEEARIPNDNSDNSQVAGSNSQQCTIKSLGQALAEEDAYHKQQLSKISGFRKFLNRFSSGNKQDLKETENSRHSEAVARIKSQYSNSDSSRNC